MVGIGVRGIIGLSVGRAARQRIASQLVQLSIFVSLNDRTAQ